MLRRKIRKFGGVLGHDGEVRKPQYVKIEGRVDIRYRYRISCYDEFAGETLYPSLRIENGVCIGPNFTVLVADKVEIGRNVLIASNVSILSENHGIDPESDIPYNAQPLTSGSISIGEGTWIGQNVSILPNVSIGKKCIVATSAVVTKNIPDYSIAAGIPAKVVKQYNFETHKWESVR